MASKRRNRRRRNRQGAQSASSKTPDGNGAHPDPGGITDATVRERTTAAPLETLPREWRATIGLVALPALVASAVFANTLNNGFTYDDKLALEQLQGPSYFTSFAFLRSGRGLTYAVHLLDRWLWGSWAHGFHLTNIALHSLASALVAYAAFVLTRSRWAALLCGLFFAVHPVHVESVASFANRKDVLAMIFVMLALILWVSRPRSPLCYVGAIFCIGLGLLSKEVAAVGLIPMLFLADLLPRPSIPVRWSDRLRRASLRFAPLLFVAIIATSMFAGDIGIYFTDETINFKTIGYLHSYNEVLATTAGSVPEVLRLLLFPGTLSADYPVRMQMHMSDPWASLGTGLVFCWMLAAILLARRSPVAAFAMVWVAVAYLPCSNVIPLTQFFVAERYLYVPSFGICLLAAMGLERSMSLAAAHGRSWTRLAIPGFAILLIVAGGTRSFIRNRDWHDDVRLWSSALRAGFETSRLHNGLAVALSEQGKHDEAIDHLTRASQLGPPDPSAMVNLATLLLKRGRFDEAIAWCRKILQMPALNAQYRRHHADARHILDLAQRAQAAGLTR
ncbi:MAG: tetratricopeptide repeat protein [Planctomycetota bacterium]|jgi:hypothetical protein